MVGAIRERLVRWRNRLLADPKIQNLAVAVPFVRPVANAKAREIFDLCIGFVHTQVITACIELDLFEHLADGPLSVDQVAERSNLSPDAASKLLAAATALKLFVRDRDGRYRLGERGAAVRGTAGIAEIIRHNQVFYRDLTDPVGLLRGEKRGQTELASYWPYAEGAAGVGALSADQVSPYTDFMSASQPFIADDVIAAYDFSRHSALLDIGGGDGTFAARVAAATPELKVGVFDLPSVAARAEARFEASGLAGRSAVHGGDFHRDPIPGGYDCVALVRILLDHDDTAVSALLARIRVAMPAGGRLVVAELMSETPGAETISDAYFGLYLLAMGRGRPRSAAHIIRLMEEAGFVGCQPLRTRRTLMTQLVTGNVASS